MQRELIATAAFGQRFPVTVVGITDGDTFTVINRDKLQLKVRIIGIDREKVCTYCWTGKE